MKKVMKRCFAGHLDSALVGYFPREISRAMWFLNLHDVIVKVEVIDHQHRRSPLVQGGLDIPAKVIIEMEHSTRGREILARYQTHFQDNNYKDTSEILKNLAAESSDSESDAVEDS